MGTESPFITPRIAAEKYLYASVEMAERLCREGVFKSARKPSGSKRGHWQISRLEVIQHVSKSHVRET